MDREQSLFKLWSPSRERTIGGDDKTGPIENEFVLPAYQVYVNQRRTQ